jgi:hypothetical protein
MGRPSFLFGRLVLIHLGGSAEFVLESGIVLVAVGFFLAGKAGVFDIFQNTVGPAVQLFSGVQWGGGLVGGHLVGSVEAGRVGCSGETAVEVGKTKVLFKGGHGFVDFVLETIITTSEVKQNGVIYDVVSNAGKGVIINDFESSSSEFLTVVELLDEVLEGSWGMPGCFHALFVGAHVAGTNFAKSRPKMSDDDNRRHFVEATSGMTE